MRPLKLLLIVVSILSTTLIVVSSGYAQFREEPEGRERNSSEMATIEIRNVRYLLPKGTKFRKTAGVITFEGAGEYTARRLYDMEERLREGRKELKRLERDLRYRGND